MSRFSTQLLQIPAQIRVVLRDRLARLLPVRSQYHNQAARDGEPLSDELFLELLLNLDIKAESDEHLVKARYEAARAASSHEGSFDDMHAAGWFRVVWGRVAVSYEMSRIAHVRAADMPSFNAAFDSRFNYQFRASQALRNSLALSEIAGRVERGETALTDIGFRDGAWIAARLWERTYSQSSDLETTLRDWIDRWNFLGSPQIVPAQVWDGTAAESFRQTAMNVLGKAALLSWDETRAHIIKQLALTHEQPIETVESYVPQIPASLFDRMLWLQDPWIERSMFQTHVEIEALSGLVRLLMADVESQSIVQAPHRIFKELMDLSVDKPELLLLLYHNSLHRPVLLADWLQYPATSSIACWHIATWQIPRDPWDNGPLLFDAKAVLSEAFADGVSLMGHFLGRGELAPEEAASLLGWLCENRRNEQANLLPILKEEIARHSENALLQMVTSLLATAPKPGLNSPRFVAVLDLIDEAQLVEKVDPEPVVSAYAESVAAGDYPLTADRVTSGAAASLFDLARRLPSDQLARFLTPIEPLSRLNQSDHDNPVVIENSVAKSIRTHTRILCRAIVGQEGEAPTELIEALVAMVWAGAKDHPQKGRVSAFSAKFEAKPFKDDFDRPIAADLGEALKRLKGETGSKLLRTILETDEPLVLAQMLEFVPEGIRLPIEERINDLTPSKAGTVHFLPAIHARIDALLNANLTVAAERYIEEEQDLVTPRPMYGRTLTQLNDKLRLLLAKGDWQGIRGASVSPDAFEQDKSEAQRTLSFFKGLAELNAPDGKPEHAAAIFSNLQQRYPDVSAYTINLFAARLQELVGSDGVTILQSEQISEGHKLLADTDAKLAQTKGWSDSDREIFIGNRAVLMLALGQPSMAWESLAGLSNLRHPDRTIAYRAIALSRMDRASEARVVVAEGIQEYGETQALLGAKAHIEANAPLALGASHSDNDDPIPSIQRAMGRLFNLDFERQARVYDHVQLEDFVIDQLRRAAAQITDMAASIRVLEIDKYEDDLTILYSKILTTQLQHLGWSFPDQTKGGRTAAGNPGERDMVLQKGNVAITVFEAVACGSSIPGEKLKEHFKKLFAYSPCQLLFHITYAKHKDPVAVLAKLKEIAREKPPGEFKFTGHIEEIPPKGTLPPGFHASYQDGFGLKKVVFLLLDLEQSAQISAAKDSAGKA